MIIKFKVETDKDRIIESYAEVIGYHADNESVMIEYEDYIVEEKNIIETYYTLDEINELTKVNV